MNKNLANLTMEIEDITMFCNSKSNSLFLISAIVFSLFFYFMYIHQNVQLLLCLSFDFFK